MTGLEIALLIALSASDAQITAANLRHNGYESNPLARPFVTHGTALTSAYFAAGTGIELYTVHHLAQRGHRRTARVVTWSLIAGEAYCVARSWQHH